MALDYERVSMILVEALYFGDGYASERWSVSRRTIQRYRMKASQDLELSHFVALKKDKFETEWINEFPAMMRAGARFLSKAAQEADHKDPETIHAIAGAMKILAEIGLTKDLIDARLRDQTGDETTPNRTAIPPTISSGVE